MAVTGDISSGITAVLSHPFTSARIEERIRNRNVFYNLISRDVGALGATRNGDYLQLDRYATARQIAATGRAEGDDVILPGTTTYASASVYPKQLMGSIGWSHERLEFARDEAAFAGIIVNDYLEHINGIKSLFDAIWFGDGTGRLARVSSYSATSATVGTVTVDNDQADFGWNLCDIMVEGMLVDIYTVADITGSSAWTRKAIQCVVSSINRTAGTFVITARSDSASNTLAGSAIDPDGGGNPANSDYVFISGAVTLTSANKWSAWALPMGIHTIVDDGQDAGAEFTESGNLYNHSWYGATVQGLLRTSAANSMFKSQVIRAADLGRGGTDGTAVATDMNDIDRALDELFQNGTNPDPGRLLGICNSPTKRWWATTAKNENNGFQNIDDGRVVPGLLMDGFRSMAAGGMIIPVVTCRTMPNGTIIWLDTSQLAFWDMFPLGPFMYGGQVQFESPGTRNLTYERWSRYFGNLVFKRSDTSLRMEDIDIS